MDFVFFSSRRRHTRYWHDWSSDVCSSDLEVANRGSVIALVLAGGTGSRMGRPKQFIKLRGRPALEYTLRAFQETPEVARIYAVGDRRRIEALAGEAGITKYVRCAEPGASRSLSTRNGLLLCEGDSETVVLVHDGSRCLVTPDLIRRVVEAVRGGAEGVVPAIPVSDTIKFARDGIVSETLDRTNLRAVQTPQAFRLNLLRRLHEAPEEYLLVTTDDASLVEREGGRRSEEHTSELQSRQYLVCRLLLEK